MGDVPFDLPRVKSVVEAITHALAYRDFGRDYIGTWNIFCASLRSSPDFPPKGVKNWNGFRAMLGAVTYSNVSTPQPEVFSYGVYKMTDWGFICRSVFYGGFAVYAWPIRPNGKAS